MNSNYTLTAKNQDSNNLKFNFNATNFFNAGLQPFKSLLQNLRLESITRRARTKATSADNLAIGEAVMTPIGDLFTLSIAGTAYTVAKVQENTYELFQKGDPCSSATIDGDLLYNPDSRERENNKPKILSKMRTFEGTMLIKWHKNDNSDRRPLTIDCNNHLELDAEKRRISAAFLNEGEKGRLAWGVKFDLTERK